MRRVGESDYFQKKADEVRMPSVRGGLKARSLVHEVTMVLEGVIQWMSEMIGTFNQNGQRDQS